MTPAPFPASFFMAGFECATHRRPDGLRLDLTAGTAHDVHAKTDYVQAIAHGLKSARDGLRWHLIEATPGRYDWSSWLPMLEAAHDTGMQTVWDIFHWGTPDHVDIFAPEFVTRIAAFAGKAAKLHRDTTDTVPHWCPLNEISFYAMIGGDAGAFHPYATGRGHELKRQLVRAHVAVADALRAVDPRARLLAAEPLIEVIPGSDLPIDAWHADRFHDSQYQACDMIAGNIEPDLGGRPDLLDIVGANFYAGNQWRHGGGPIFFGHHKYRALSAMLADLHARFDRPIVISETGAEASARAPWLHYVAQETRIAIASGIPVTGICLYPVTDYPGWDDDRECPVGLFGITDADGKRTVYAPLSQELERQSLLD